MRRRGTLAPVLIAAPLFAAALNGCGLPKAQFIRDPYPKPATVAVLPFANHSNDVKVPEFMRRLAAEALAKGGYEVVPVEQVDAKLRGAGITQGGQLRAKAPEELAGITGADAVFTGTVRKASHVTLGFYLNRKVEFEAEMFDAGGARVWKHAAAASSSDLELDAREAGKALAGQLAEKWVETVLSHPLYPEMRQSLYKVFMTLPARHSPRRVGESIRSWRRGLWHQPASRRRTRR